MHARLGVVLSRSAWSARAARQACSSNVNGADLCRQPMAGARRGTIAACALHLCRERQCRAQRHSSARSVPCPGARAPAHTTTPCRHAVLVCDSALAASVRWLCGRGPLQSASQTAHARRARLLPMECTCAFLCAKRHAPQQPRLDRRRRRAPWGGLCAVL